MSIEHIAVASNSEEDSDNFIIGLLELERTRDFVVSEDLMKNLFNIKKEQKIIRYGNKNLDVEVFITNDSSKALDTWTHTCILIQDREKLVEKAKERGYQIIQVPRKDSHNYYLFLKDGYGNRYEIKSA